MSNDDLSIVVRNYVIAAGIGLGGLWAFWKWSFSEWLRQRKNMPAVDGDLSADSVALNDEKIVLSLSALWRNRGDHPVYIDHEATRIDVYKIDEDIGEGAFEPKTSLGEPIFQSRPHHDFEAFVLEPRTESLLKTHYILLTGEVYLFRWKLYRNRKHGDVLYAWTKELVHKAVVPNPGLKEDVQL